MGVFQDPVPQLSDQIRAGDGRGGLERCAVAVRGVLSPSRNDTPRSHVSPFAASQANWNIGDISITVSPKSGAALSCTLPSVPSPAEPQRKSAALIASLKRFGSKLLGSKTKRLLDQPQQDSRSVHQSARLSFEVKPHARLRYSSSGGESNRGDVSVRCDDSVRNGKRLLLIEKQLAAASGSWAPTSGESPMVPPTSLHGRCTVGSLLDSEGSITPPAAKNNRQLQPLRHCRSVLTPSCNSPIAKAPMPVCSPSPQPRSSPLSAASDLDIALSAPECIVCTAGKANNSSDRFPKVAAPEAARACNVTAAPKPVGNTNRETAPPESALKPQHPTHQRHEQLTEQQLRDRQLFLWESVPSLPPVDAKPATPPAPAPSGPHTDAPRTKAQPAQPYAPAPVPAGTSGTGRAVPADDKRFLAAAPTPAAAPTLITSSVRSPAAAHMPSAPPAPAQAAAATPAGSLGPMTLLALGRGLPPAMARPVWSLDDYAISRRVYKGATSAIYKATCLRSGLPVALKVYFLDRVPPNTLHMVVREIRIQAALNHPNCLALYGAFQDPKRLVLAMEWAPRGDLQLLRCALERPLAEDQLAELVVGPLCEALAHLHAKGVCHRDIKPENLLLSANWELKVADYGVSINTVEERAVTRAGTADYMAPEVERCPLKHRPEDNKHDRALAYTTAADVWSVGVLTYELLVGFTPIVTQQPHHHHHHDLPETPLDMAFAALGVGGERRRRRGPPVFTRDTLRFPVSVSGPARDFILSALAEHPSDRPTAVQLLRHPWLAAVRQRVQQQQQAPAHGAVTVQHPC